MNCPSCGAPIEIKPGDITIVCQYCNTVLFIEKKLIKEIGEKNPVYEFPSKFTIGGNYNINGKDLIINGYILYDYGGGFYKERLAKDDKYYIIGEDDTNITLFEIEKYQNINFNFNIMQIWNGYFVQEIGRLKILTFHGNFPFKLNKTCEYVNLIKNGKLNILKNFGNDILFFKGI